MFRHWGRDTVGDIILPPERQMTPSPMSPDEMEAKSWRHGSRSLVLVPLSSGKFAIFDRWGQELFGIVKLPESVMEKLMESSKKSIKLHQAEESPPTNSSLQSDKSADELGL